MQNVTKIDKTTLYNNIGDLVIKRYKKEVKKLEYMIDMGIHRELVLYQSQKIDELLLIIIKYIQKIRKNV